MELDRTKIGAAIGRIPSGCSILTAQHAGRSSGVLVSWVQQAAFEPPAVSVALRRGRPIVGLIDGSGRFLLNLIDENPTAMFKHFGKGFSLDDDAFGGLGVEQTEYGPALSACIARMGCRVLERVTVGDHDLYLGEVESGGVVEGAHPYVHIRANGLNY